MKILSILPLRDSIDTLYVCTEDNVNVSVRHTYEYTEFDKLTNAIKQGIDRGVVFCFRCEEDYEFVRQYIGDIHIAETMIYQIVYCNPATVYAMAEQITH